MTESCEVSYNRMRNGRNWAVTYSEVRRLKKSE